MRVTIVGGGILGTAHALEAIGRGHEVVQLEREAEARGATVRNFGLIWVSGRATDELVAALRARELWEKLGAEIPAIGFRPAGSLTLLRTEREVAVADEVVTRADAECRGFTLLEADRVRALNPALRGKYLAGLHCSLDAAVESRQALPAMREYMAATGRYTFFRAPRRGRSTVRPSSTIAVLATTATWCWCAQAQRTAASSASSQAIFRCAACGCR